MPCTGRFATAAEYDALMCSDLDLTDAAVLAKVETILDIAASDIHAAMAANDQCGCNLAAWAVNYLKKLNILDAAVIYHCPCGDVLTPEDRVNIRTWINEQLELIRTGKIELCDGQTGTEYPAFASAQQTLTEWTTAEIIRNR